METQKQIEIFKKDLNHLGSNEMVRKYITFGNPHIIDESKYFDLKNIISEYFSIHPSQVVVVGSGKLGFSISENLRVDPPKKRFRHFSDDSDIDIALVSDELFTKIWMEVYEFHKDKGYWYNMPKFSQYLFQGWIRPDKLPSSKIFKLANEWWDFFQMLSNSGEYGSFKMRAGLYKNWYFLENYHEIAINQCKEI